jgi:hypothetical protein
MGGTEIYNPLEIILNQPKIPNYDKVIFLVTDGQVYNEDAVVKLIRSKPNVRIQAIGIGNGVSKNLIIEAALEGKGKYEFVSTRDSLRLKMIYLLEDSITPFLEEFSMDYDKSIVMLSQDVN